MPSVGNSELWIKIGEFLFQWGTPGVIIIFLLEERRRLTNKVDVLQTKVEENMKNELKKATEYWGILREHENAFTRLSDQINTLLSTVIRSK